MQIPPASLRWWFFHHSVDRRLGPASVRLDLSNVNGPELYGDWSNEDHYAVALSWGNGNSDPVWSVDLTVRLPGPLARWFTRRYDQEEVG